MNSNFADSFPLTILMFCSVITALSCVLPEPFPPSLSVKVANPSQLDATDSEAFKVLMILPLFYKGMVNPFKMLPKHRQTNDRLRQQQKAF